MTVGTEKYSTDDSNVKKVEPTFQHMSSFEYEDPLYGTLKLSGAPAQVIENPAVQRLKHIHQNGGVFLVNPDMDTTRFENSLGVAALCKRFGASEREVLAALLHDVGHTAFSHVADHVFDRTDQAFHEDEIWRIVTRYGLDKCLDSLGYDPDTVLEIERFSVLEQDLPHLCADRLDYQLRDVYKYGLIDREDINAILNDIILEGEQLVASDHDTAHTIVDISLLLQRQVYFNKENEAANLILKSLIESALEQSILTPDELFQTDQDVLNTLRSNAEFAETLDALDQNLTVKQEPSQEGYSITRKRRTMNPCVAGTRQHISDLDSTVARKIERFRDSIPLEQQYTITFTE